MLSHLNMQPWIVTPGIIWEIFYQSSNYMSLSRLSKKWKSAYLESTQTKILISYSLQFFFILLFFSIFSILTEAILKMVSSLM